MKEGNLWKLVYPIAGGKAIPSENTPSTQTTLELAHILDGYKPLPHPHNALLRLGPRPFHPL